MSGNGSRIRSKEYGTKGPLLPTPRSCSGLRSSGANQTELLMSAERILDGKPPMTTSEPSQPPLFDLGSEEREPKLGPLWPTPAANDDNKSPSAHMAMKARMPGGPRQTVTSLQVATKAGIEPSTSSPPATPANPSLRPGSDWARRMTVISGQRLHGSLPTSDPAASSVRTLLGTSAWASTTCYLTWKRSATPAGRLFFRLVPSTRLTAGIVSGLLHTPTETANYHCPSMQGRWPGSYFWPTVTEQDSANNGGPSQYRRRSLPLNTAVQMWPTPMPSDVDGGRTTKGKDRPNEHGLRLEVGGKLNPTWVEWLMGYPSGWTDLEDSATPSSPRLPT